MQPGQQPPQGFQWDSAGQQTATQQQFQPAPQMIQGTTQTMMGGGAYGQHQMMVQPSTSATAALVISLVALVGGFIFGLPFCLAPISLIMANSALKTTTMYPGHSDHGLARAAQIISAIISGFMALGLAGLALFFGLLMSQGF